jgi:N-acetylglucosaminyl-diphospho-decaprenol L-rhamnosyltransferase
MGEAGLNRKPAQQPGGSANGVETAAPEVSVIIINWNSADYVRKCLRSVYQHTQGLSFEVIVVDSASHDGCGEMLSREFPNVRFIQSPENVGFGQANNLAARQARGRALLLLNPDTEFREDSMRVLHEHLWSCPDAAAVGCRLLNGDGSLQTSCVQSFPTVLNQLLGTKVLHRTFPHWRMWGLAPLRSAKASPAEAISGACIMVKREAFDRVGGFSSQYFMYGEDLDLCFKIKESGYRVYHVPDTTIVHFGGGSTFDSSQSNVMMRESVYRFLAHNRGKSSAVLYRGAMAVASVTRMILILPILLFPRRDWTQRGIATLRKWRAIFRWSLGFPSPVRAGA